MGRMWPRRALAAVGLLALAWGSYRAAAGWWYRAELARAQREIAAGRSGPARERLARLSASWPGEAEVHYELGRLRAGRGASRPGAGGLGTDRARVALRREGGPRGKTSCSGISSTGGRFAELESLLEVARRGNGAGAAAAERDPRPAPALRGAIRRGEAPAPGRVGPGRGPLPHAARTSGCSMPSRSRSRWSGASSTRRRSQAPDDDRVWLGRANLATWTGRFEEADRWL